jgi:hypothetical protein
MFAEIRRLRKENEYLERQREIRPPHDQDVSLSEGFQTSLELRARRGFSAGVLFVNLSDIRPRAEIRVL